jgi:beta-phosphoglucomutase-like phosphatase (HAD superfamily)
VIEDAVSGVQAGAKGKFALVIGIARENNAGELRANGADVVVADLAETNLEKIGQWVFAKTAALNVTAT